MQFTLARGDVTAFLRRRLWLRFQNEREKLLYRLKRRHFLGFFGRFRPEEYYDRYSSLLFWNG